jgi:hypothetical protein
VSGDDSKPAFFHSLLWQKGRLQREVSERKKPSTCALSVQSSSSMDRGGTIQIVPLARSDGAIGRGKRPCGAGTYDCGVTLSPVAACGLSASEESGRRGARSVSGFNIALTPASSQVEVHVNSSATVINIATKPCSTSGDFEQPVQRMHDPCQPQNAIPHIYSCPPPIHRSAGWLSLHPSLAEIELQAMPAQRSPMALTLNFHGSEPLVALDLLDPEGQ